MALDPPGKGAPLLRVAVLVFIVVVAILLWRAGGEPIQALKTPALRPAPEIFEAPQPASERGGTFEELRLGGFERPGGVPAYEILEEWPTGSDGARSARLLVDTRSRSQEDFTLITRDLKARYADYDLVSVEFTDVSVVLGYNGGAIIVNTPLGAQRAGFIHAPPIEGYYVKAAD
jgi:hypothetical protein